VSAETIPDQFWNPTHVVKMRMRHEHSVNLFGSKGKRVKIFAFAKITALEHPAVNEDFLLQSFKIIAGAGHFTRGAAEGEMHSETE
jgi:hypothetical protein